MIYNPAQGGIMYQVLLIAQVLTVSLALYASLSLLNFRLGIDSRYLIMTSCCLSVYALGYLLEFYATDRATALYALRFQYLGVSFIGSFFALFVHSYCRIQLSKKLTYLMIAVNTAVLFFAEQFIDTGWYFKSAEWATDSFFPHMEYVPGVGYVVYITFLGLTLIGAMLVALRYRKTVFKEVERRRLVYIVIMCTTPFVGVTIARTHLFGGYDPTCIVVVITLRSFFATK